MYSTILPELMSITVFILTLLCLQAGHNPSFMQNYAILSLNTTGLKNAYSQHTQAGLPIHDVYNLHMMTSCSGYWTNSSFPLVDVACSSVSLYCLSLPPPLLSPKQSKHQKLTYFPAKFLPATLIDNDLQAHHSNTNLTSLSFPQGIQDAFNERFNLQLHVALIFYVFALVWLGIVIVWGLMTCWWGVLGSAAVVFTSVCLSPFPLKSYREKAEGGS